MFSSRGVSTIRQIQNCFRPHLQCRTITRHDSSLAATSSSNPPHSTPSEIRRRAEYRMQIPSDMSEPEYAASVVHGRSLEPAYQHPRTYNIPVALLHFRSHFPHLLDLYTHFATHAAAALAIPCSRPVLLPTKRSLWTVLRGPFAHKKSQENFERLVHRRAIKAWDADTVVVDRWLAYLRLYPVAGVGVRVVRWYRAPVGIGQAHEAMQLENVTHRQRVEDVAKKIVKQEMTTAGLSQEQRTIEAGAGDAHKAS